jgi:hypothetical protein
MLESPDPDLMKIKEEWEAQHPFITDGSVVETSESVAAMEVSHK